MLCEKCGKINNPNSSQCMYCGAAMPLKSECGGFGDILDFEAINNPQADSSRVSGGADAAELRKLEKELDSLKEATKKASLLSLGSMVLAIVSIVVCLLCVSCGSDEKVYVGNDTPVEANETDVGNDTPVEANETDVDKNTPDEPSENAVPDLAGLGVSLAEAE